MYGRSSIGGTEQDSMSVTHYESGVSYIEAAEGWRVEAGCGAVLKTAGCVAPDWITSDLDKVDCKRCREVNALEILALVP
jgi:hypothetical protein